MIVFVSTLSVRGQADYGNKADALQLCKVIQGNQFTNYREANSAIEDILSVIGAKNRFVVQPCDNINNAAAVTLQGIRYIFFDPDFMNSISSGTYSSNLFILAHEVGHHINGHSQDIIMLLSDYAPTSATLAEERAEELEADEFAGFVMGKLEYRLSSMQKTLRVIADDSDDTYSTHPSLYKRLGAVETGYNSARGNQELKFNVLSNQQRAEEYFYNAFTKLILEDYKGAITDYTKAIDLDSNYTVAYFQRGNAKDELKDYRGAITDYTKAIDLDPNHTKAYVNRGADKGELKDYKGAITDYSKAIDLDPNEVLAYINRGYDKSELKDYRGALMDYDKAIEIDPNNFDAYFNRAGAKSQLKDYQGMVADYSKVIEIDPNYAKAYAARGFGKFSQGDKDGGCLDWSKAGELGYGDAYDFIKNYCQ